MKTSPPPIIGTTKPRNGTQAEFGPREVQEILCKLARRQMAHAARLSSVSRLRGQQ